MEKTKDDAILLEDNYRPQLFLHKTISLTIPACALLIVTFLSSALIVSIISFYWTEGTICYINNNEQIQTDQSKSRPIYYSRPKRSIESRKVSWPCFGVACCSTNLDPTTPWNQSRLPTNIYPVEYQLELELFDLNEENDRYSGTVDLVVEIRSSTNDIISSRKQD